MNVNLVVSISMWVGRCILADNANCTVLCLHSPDINRHPVTTCDIHRIIDNKFASSSFTKNVRMHSP